MKKFVIERLLPGAGNLSEQELKELAQTSCSVIQQMGQPYHWIESFVTGDKIYCIHIAESEAVVREHAKRGNFPIHSIYEVKSMMDPQTGG